MLLSIEIGSTSCGGQPHVQPSGNCLKTESLISSHPVLFIFHPGSPLTGTTAIPNAQPAASPTTPKRVFKNDAISLIFLSYACLARPYPAKSTQRPQLEDAVAISTGPSPSPSVTRVERMIATPSDAVGYGIVVRGSAYTGSVQLNPTTADPV